MNQRALALGAFRYPYVFDYWLEPLKHAFGARVVPVDVDTMLAALPRHEVEQYICAEARRTSATHVFVFHDLIFADLSQALYSRLREQGLKVVAFYSDDEPEVWYGRNRQYDARYDVIATHSVVGFQRRSAAGIPGVLYCPWSFNPRAHRCEAPEGPVVTRTDVAYFGRAKKSRIGGVAREDGVERERQLLLVAEMAVKMGFGFALYGFGWEHHPVLSRFARGPCPRSEFPDVIRTAKVVFNPSYSADEVPRPQLKLRHFEVAGFGGVQLSNRNEELDALLSPGEEYLPYGNDQELAAELERALGSHALRERVAGAARARVYREHLVDHRIAEIARAAEFECGVGRTLPSIRRVLRGTDPEATREAVAGCDSSFVELIDPGELREPLDVASLGDVFAALPDAVSFPVLERSNAIHRDSVQPRREELVARVVGSLREVDEGATPGDRDALFEWATSGTAGKGVVLRREYALASFDQAPRVVHVPALCGGRVVPNRQTMRGAVDSPMERFAWIMNQRGASKTFMVYGARGDLAELVLEVLADSRPRGWAGIIDNSLVGTELLGFEVIGHSQLVESPPDIVFVAAAISGPRIVESCAGLPAACELVKLFDRFSWGSVA